jgi:transposase
MPKILRVREMTPEELTTIHRLAHSRTEAARLVERARIVWLSHQGQRVPAIARELGREEYTVRLWLRRFTDRGVKGLADAPRSGAPPTYSPEQVGEVIAAALTDPQQLGQPFGSWTLDRLAVYLNEGKGIGIKRSRIGEILLAEGLRWWQQESWFGERVDPRFAEKRGPLSRSTPSRQPGVSS